MPRLVVPSLFLPSDRSKSRSSSRWYGMIRWALPESLMRPGSRPSCSSWSTSSRNEAGSSTTPSAMTGTTWERAIPDGTRCSFRVMSPMMTVWPALLPPAYRTTKSARSARTSTNLPLLSSPHCIPTTTVAGTWQKPTRTAPPGPALFAAPVGPQNRAEKWGGSWGYGTNAQLPSGSQGAGHLLIRPARLCLLSAVRKFLRVFGGLDPTAAGHRYAVEIAGDDHVGEDLGGLVAELAFVGVALGEVGENEQPGPGLGRDVSRLSRGEVAVGGRQVAIPLEEGALAYDHVGLLGQGHRRVAQSGVHDEREPLTGPVRADLGQGDPPTADLQLAFALQPAHVRSRDAQLLQLLGKHAAPVGLFQPVAVGLGAVVE